MHLAMAMNMLGVFLKLFEMKINNLSPKNISLGAKQIWIKIITLLLINQVTLNKSINVSGPQFCLL